MNDERITALEAEVKRLAELLEKPRVRVDFSADYSRGEVYLNLLNIGFLPIIDFKADIEKIGQREQLPVWQRQSIWQYVNHSEHQWPILPGELRQFKTTPHQLHGLKSNPSEWHVVIRSGDELVEAFPIDNLLQILK